MEKYGKDGTSLNENIANKSKLGRFGYGTCHHIGALSAKVLGSYDNTAAPRYELWAAEMLPDLEDVEAELIRLTLMFYLDRILNIQGTV